MFCIKNHQNNWVAQPRLLKRNVFGGLLKIPLTKTTSVRPESDGSPI